MDGLANILNYISFPTLTIKKILILIIARQ